MGSQEVGLAGAGAFAVTQVYSISLPECLHVLALNVCNVSFEKNS